MATYTLNYKLKKPAESDFYSVKDFNDNADTIDAKLKLGVDAKTLVDSLNTNMTSAQKDLDMLVQRSVIIVEVWAPPNTQVTLEQGALSFSGTVGSSMKLLAPVSTLGTWEMSYTYANKTYFKDIRVDNLGYNRVLAPPSLAASPWDYIAMVSEAGLAREAYVLGDTKSLTSSMGTYDVQIIGFDHDFYSVPKPGRERAGITFQMKTPTGANYIMDSDTRFVQEWEYVNMRTDQLPLIFDSLPVELQDAIKMVRKYTSLYNRTLGSVTTDDLFLFSDYELLGYKSVYSDYPFAQQYEYYRCGHTPYKNTPYWLRNNVPGVNGLERFLVISNDSQSPKQVDCNNPQGLCLGFCV